jgi:Ca2+-binding EF-hand superfamily protein
MLTLSIFTETDITKKLKFAFKIFNAHKNTGKIDLESIIKVCESIDELHGIKSSLTRSKNRAREIFYRFNKSDLNERLNEEEFINGILRDPSIIFLLNIII